MSCNHSKTFHINLPLYCLTVYSITSYRSLVNLFIAKKENKKTENRKRPTKAATKDQNKLELDDQSKPKIEIEPAKKRRGRPKKDNTEKSKLNSNLAVALDKNEEVHSKEIAVKKQNPKAKAPREVKKPKETKNKTPRSGWWSRNK